VETNVGAEILAVPANPDDQRNDAAAREKQADRGIGTNVAQQDRKASNPLAECVFHLISFALQRGSVSVTDGSRITVRHVNISSAMHRSSPNGQTQFSAQLATIGTRNIAFRQGAPGVTAES
jgi:hypothetical protein